MLSFGDLEHIRKLLSPWPFRWALTDKEMLDLETMFDWQQNPIFCYFLCCFCFFLKKKKVVKAGHLQYFLYKLH